MARINTHGDLLGRVVAALVIGIGVTALGFVFFTAVHLFESPVPGLGLPVPNGQAPPSGVTIGIALAGLFSKLAVLAVMVLVGSLIATKGVHLYGAAIAHHPHAGQPENRDTPPFQDASNSNDEVNKN